MITGEGPTTGFTTLDGAALVLGAAVAAVHLRDLVTSGHPGVFGWVLFWLAFTGLATTAAGPFVFLVRRYVRRLIHYPRLGDGLWTVLGMPWILTAPLRPRPPFRSTSPLSQFDAEAVYALALWLLLLSACLASLVVIWRYWVRAPGAGPEVPDRPRPTWTEWIGLTLAIAWPIQCGFGLLVTG